MTPTDLSTLRAIALAAKTISVTQDNWAAFEKAFPPKACVSMLDEIEALRARVESAETVLEAVRDQYENVDLSHKDYRVKACVAASAHFTKFTEGKI